jgi:hypothetical protein
MLGRQGHPRGYTLSTDPGQVRAPHRLAVIHRGAEQPGFFAHGLRMQTGEYPLDFLPGNQRPPTGRYACLVIVQDYVRMLRRVTDSMGAWHYSELEPEVLEDVRGGRAVLVFDLSNEGPLYDPEIFRELYRWLAQRSVPAPRCIWLAQNRALELAARADPQGPTPGLRFVHYDFFIKVAAWLFSPQSDRHPLAPDPAAWAGRLFDAGRKDRMLLCLNATPRLQRILTVAALDHHQLLEESLVSFPGFQYAKEGISLDQALSFVDQQEQLRHLRPAVLRLAGLPRRRVDHFAEIGNQLVAKVDPTLYERTFLSLVTESDFSNGAVDRVTEKTAKAFCMGHPTLVVGNPNAVRFMTALGFQDWDQVLDRRIDAIADPATRFTAVIEETRGQVARIRADADAWIDATREVGRFNLQHALSGDFLRACRRHIDEVAVDEILAALG